MGWIGAKRVPNLPAIDWDDWVDFRMNEFGYTIAPRRFKAGRPDAAKK